MTLPNLEWTDKWFIMLPSGHEGPYSLKALKARVDSKTLAAESRIWTEGLLETVSLKSALYKMEVAPTKKLQIVHTPEEIHVPIPEFIPQIRVESFKVPVTKEAFTPFVEDEDDIPPLPPLPDADDENDIDQIPTAPDLKKRVFKIDKFSFAVFGLCLMGFMGYIFYVQWINSQQNFSIRRYAKMSPELHERIMNEMAFEGWDKKIFFKEYVPTDLSVIWLVNSGFETCDVEANFQSVDGKLLSMKSDKVIFKSQAILKSHVAEFSRYEFISGTKVVPGLYELNVEAKNCQWDSLAAKMANHIRKPDPTYIARMKVVLFPQGALEFNALLDKLIQKKNDIQIKLETKDELFWQDLQQKLQTLLAISLQIEQFFIEVLDKDARKFPENLKTAVNDYTKQFGHGLTNFVVSNEDYFKEMPLEDLQRISKGKNYEKLIRLTTKEVGLESMKLIEELQKLKNPKRAKLNEEKKNVSRAFEKVRADISEKLVQVTSDQAQ
jgi:hypothetical protein